MSDQIENEGDDFRSGFVALIGRPNAGKSTLVNQIVGTKISIVSHRPQTTRNRVIGVINGEGWQIAFVDTPGIHKPGRKRLNRMINQNALAAVDGVDVAALMITAEGWRKSDEPALQALIATNAKKFLLINKVDTVKDKTKLLPLIQESSERADFDEILPVCATKGHGVDAFIETLVMYMPNLPAGYPEGQITDRPIQFQSGELIREQLFRQLNDEIPYGTAVNIDEMEDEGEVFRIAATIWVENESQKPIVIGKGGERLKRIASNARTGLQRLIGKQVFLEVWVKVRRGWGDDPGALREIGMNDDA